MGQVNGSKPFFVKGYTSAPLMSYMKALASRALVDFGGVMDGMSNDGTITAKIFRINQVGEANGKLVQELKDAESAKNIFVKQSHGRINADYTDYTDGPEYDSYVDGPFAPTGEEITYDPEYEYESEPSAFN
ncbi:hypothetical protein OC835_005123 [Tilletia horrida]|nr:hypothetical protein OC835_005123 [Tilletia horrida]